MKPLKIKSILISQPKPSETEKNPYVEIGKKHNVKVEFRKLFKVEGIAAKDFRKEKVNILDYSAVLFTSKNAADNYFRICNEMRIEVPETMKYFCTTESIALYLQKYIVYRKRKVFFGKQNINDLAELFKKHKTESILFPISENAGGENTQILDELKISYKTTPMFRNVDEEIKDIVWKNIDMLVLFSPSGVKSLLNNFPEFKQSKLILAAYGSSTHEAIKKAGLTLHIEAPTPECPSMSTAIDNFITKNNKLK